MSKEPNQAIDIMLRTGEWVTVSLFHSGDFQSDAVTWVENHGEKLGDVKPLELPCGTFVLLDRAIAIRWRDS